MKQKLLRGSVIAGALIASLHLTVSVNAHEVKDGNKVEQTHDLSGFNKISITGVYDADIKVGGNDYSVFTSGRAKDVQWMKVYVDGDTLILAQNEKKKKGLKTNNTQGVNVEITLPALEGLAITGVGQGHITGIDSNRFSIEIAGVGDMELSGRCGYLDADIAGMGQMDASDLKCEDVNIDLAGMGQASVYASNSVDADAAGMGNVEVYGNPDTVKKDSNFMSSVRIK